MFMRIGSQTHSGQNSKLMAGTPDTPAPAGKPSPLAVAGTTTIKVSIVEDDDWIRENLASQIDLAPGFRCISRYRTGEEAMLRLPGDTPDVVLMDINLPGLSGIECVRRLKALLPSLNILMLTVYEESDQIFDSLRAGASGYLLKRSAETELLDAIAQVHQGGSPMSSLVARKVVQFFNHIDDAAPELQRLSPREKEILELLSRGAAYKEIGSRLSLSIHTVRMHIRGIYGKLQVHSRGEAVAKYLRP
jgi:DNA-binding NarL/FixJ family response regulator